MVAVFMQLLFFFDYFRGLTPMSNPSLKASGTGTGLQPVQGPQGLKLASSPFTSTPDEKAAVVDVYDITKPGVINNGIKETKSILDTLSGITGGIDTNIKGVVAGVSDKVKSTLDSTKGLQDTLKSASKIASNAMAGASKVANAVNAVKSGNLGAAFAGVASLTNVGGMGQLSSLVKGVGAATSVVDRAQRSFERGGVAGITNGVTGLASGFGMGQINSTVRGVSSAINTATRISNAISNKGALSGLASINGFNSFDGFYSSASSAKRLVNTYNNASQNTRYNLTSPSFDTLKDIDRGLNIASSSISNLGQAASKDFEKGYTRSVYVGNNYPSAQSSSRASLYSLIDEFDGITSHNGKDNNAAKIGLATGLVSAGIGLGVTDAFSTVAGSGKLDDNSTYLCALTSSSIAGTAGSFSVLEDISSNPLGLKAMQASSKVVKTAAKNFTLDKQDIGKPFTQVWDKVESVSFKVGQSLTTSNIGPKEMVDASTIASNEILTQVASVKASFIQREHHQSLFDAPTSTKEVSALSAISAALAARSIVKDYGMIDAISLGYM